MCFSAEASFVSAALVGTCAYFTLREVREPRQIPLASLPLCFALQQVCEGLVWVFKNNQMESNALFWLSAWLYVLMSFVLWPVLFPLSALLLEKVKWRWNALLVCLVLGVGVSTMFLWRLVDQGISVNIVGHTLQYHVTDQLRGLPFLAVLSLSFLLSSTPRLWVMGIAAPLSFAISGYFYWESFTSVWCFFAALLSPWIYLVMRQMRREPEPIALPLPDQQSSSWTRPPEN
jgi:hypothetical protein